MDEELNLEVKKSFVKSCACFKVLNDNEITELAELLVETQVKAGEVIVTKGDIVKSVFIIVAGTAEVQSTSVDNGITRIEKLAELGPKETIGLSQTGLYSLSGRRTATVVAKTDMTLLRLKITVFNGFVLSHSHVYSALNAVATAESSENNDA